MNRTDRMLAILLELQARRYTRGEDLAAHFEVSVRTIYRDVLALCEAGVPVVATPGYGYTLPPGYFLPPLMLTPDEAGMLLLGAAFVAEQVDAPYRQAVDTARKKIDKLLPDATRREVAFLQDSLRFVGGMRLRDPALGDRMTVLRRAIQERAVLHIQYHARHGEPGERDIEPHGLVYMDGTWIVAAYCRARQAMRNFRLDRIDAIMLQGDQFVRRSDFTLHRSGRIEYGPDEVQVLFTPEAVRWVRENLHFTFVREEAHPDGIVLVFRPRTLAEFLPWLLGWGTAARVLAPAALQDAVRAIAQAFLAVYPAPAGIERVE